MSDPTKAITSGSLWEPPPTRAPSALEGLVVTPPSDALLAAMDRAAREEEERSPFREQVSEETQQRPLS